MQVKGLLYLENYLFGWPDGQITDSYLSKEVPWSKKFPGPVGFHSSTAGACARVCVCVRTRTCVLPQSSLAKLPNPAFFYCNPLISNGVCSSVLTNLIFLSSICTGTLCLSPQVIQCCVISPKSVRNRPVPPAHQCLLFSHYPSGSDAQH